MSIVKMTSKLTPKHHQYNKEREQGENAPGLTPFVYVPAFLHALYHATQVGSVSFGATYEKLSGICIIGNE